MPVFSQLRTFRLIYDAEVFISNGPKFSDPSLHQIFTDFGIFGCGQVEKPNPDLGCFEVSESFFFCLRLYFDRTDSVILKIWRLRYTKCELASWVKRALLKTAAMATVGRLCHQGCPIRASLYIDSIVNSAHLALEGNYHPVRNLSVQFEPPIYITGKWNVVLSVLISELRRSKLRTVIWIL